MENIAVTAIEGTQMVAATSQTAMMENIQRMHAVVAEMKEVPYLPSEEPKDISPLQRVEFPVDGGIHTYMEGHEYPYKGFPFYEFVDRIDLIKKVLRSFLSGCYHELKGKNKVIFLTLLPSAWILKHAVRTGIYAFHRIIERFKIKPVRYCTSIRELHRVFSIDKDRERLKSRELRLRLRDVICMVLEFDNAYRFRLQDVIVELDKNNLKRSAAKEIIRLFSILQSREKTQDVRDTWTLFKLFIHYYLWSDKEMSSILSDSMIQLNIEKLKLSIEDKHYCEKRLDYQFEFMKK